MKQNVSRRDFLKGSAAGMLRFVIDVIFNDTTSSAAAQNAAQACIAQVKGEAVEVAAKHAVGKESSS